MMFSFKNLKTTPNSSLKDSHYYCDYIEIVALINSSDEVRNSDIYERFFQDGRISGAGTEDCSEASDEWSNKIRGWFSELEVRSYFYGESYPFVTKDGSISLKEELEDDEYLYLALLISSSLKYVEGGSLFTSVFEEISSATLKNYLPSPNKVFVFGKSSVSDNRYTGTLKQKIKKLADDLSCRIKCDDKIFSALDTGDGGLDIVGWAPFVDDPNLDNIQVYFAQSATGKNWDSKQHSVARLSNYITMPHGAQNALFVPYDFRDIDRDFKERGTITASIVFDRHRILKLVDSSSIWNTEFGANLRGAIAYAVEYEEDIV